MKDRYGWPEMWSYPIYKYSASSVCSWILSDKCSDKDTEEIRKALNEKQNTRQHNSPS